MGDTGDIWRAYADERAAAKLRRVETFGSNWTDAARMAAMFGFELRRRGENHFQLSERTPGGWLINVYPSNGRLYADRARKRAPFVPADFNRSEGFTAVDLVRALLKKIDAVAVAAIRGNSYTVTGVWFDTITIAESVQAAPGDVVVIETPNGQRLLLEVDRVFTGERKTEIILRESSV